MDENTAELSVPFEEQTESFVVRFDPETGWIATMEAMRYREAGEGKSKILWITRFEPGALLPGANLGAVGAEIIQALGQPEPCPLPVSGSP